MNPNQNMSALDAHPKSWQLVIRVPWEMYVCMQACMHACMHACNYVCMYVCMYVNVW